VFNYSAMNEVVTPESGFLVGEATAEAYAEGIMRALPQAASKREGAKRRAQFFRMDPQIDRVVELYRDVLHERNTHGRGGMYETAGSMDASAEPGWSGNARR
jgi:hypothetical protein